MAYHKKGFINSTFGNWARGFLGGGLLSAGIAAAACFAVSLVFPPALAALPFVAAGAGLIGGQTVGFLSGTGGGIRWFGELLGGRKHPDPEMRQGRSDMGPGLVTALVSALVAGEGLRSGVARWASNGKISGRDLEAPEAYDRGGRYNPASLEAPEMPAILESRKGENGMVRLTRADLANPDIREAMKTYGREMQQYNTALARSGAVGEAMQRLRDSQAAPGFNGGTRDNPELCFMKPEQFMDAANVKWMSEKGRGWERDIERQQRAEMKEFEKLNKEVGRTRGGVEFQSFDEHGQVVAAPQKAPEPVVAAPQPERQEHVAQPAVAPAPQPEASRPAPALDPQKHPALAAAGFEIPASAARVSELSQDAKAKVSQISSTLQGHDVRMKEAGTVPPRAASTPVNTQAQQESRTRS